MNIVVGIASGDDVQKIGTWLNDLLWECGAINAFKHHVDILEGAVSRREMRVIRRAGFPVAYMTGTFESFDGLLGVRADERKAGLGRALVSEAIERAKRSDLSMCHILYSSAAAREFWQRMGFVLCKEGKGEGFAFRHLQKRFDVPSGAPLLDVKMSFYSGRAAYDTNVQPIEVRRVKAWRTSHSELSLAERVGFFLVDEALTSDAVLEIDLAGEIICREKVKHLPLIGQQSGHWGDVYFDWLVNCG